MQQSIEVVPGSSQEQRRGHQRSQQRAPPSLPSAPQWLPELQWQRHHHGQETHPQDQRHLSAHRCRLSDSDGLTIGVKVRARNAIVLTQL